MKKRFLSSKSEFEIYKLVVIFFDKLLSPDNATIIPKTILEIGLEIVPENVHKILNDRQNNNKKIGLMKLH